MNKTEKIRYAIEKECSRTSLTEWCECWEFTVDEFKAYLDRADKAVKETEEHNG